MDRNVFLTLTVRNVPVALRKESVDRNVNLRVVDGSKSSSLSARRAWIEIYIIKITDNTPAVALRKESVDRNFLNRRKRKHILVALRKESVDRNVYLYNFKMFACVALRKESVDRNKL